MRVFAKRTLRTFWTKHEDAEQQLKAWHSAVEKANWETPHEVKQVYPKVKILNNNRAVFKICGNKYRLVVKFNYQKGWAFVRFIGTHKEYDQIDANTI